MGSNVQWSFSIQGNGLAASGLVRGKVPRRGRRLLRLEHHGRLDIRGHPGALLPRGGFRGGDEIESSTTPLGLGAHPVGTPFDMGWKLENTGTSIWEPDVSMELPSDDWQSSCAANPGDRPGRVVHGLVLHHHPPEP